MSKLFDQLYRTERREVPIRKEPPKDSRLEIALALIGFAILGIIIAWELSAAMPIPHGLR